MYTGLYLAAPEVENDRRALNTFHGLRRARKEGRYMGMAPYGYDNKITEDGKKYIAPVINEAKIVRWIFEEIAKEIFNTESVYHMAKDRGLTCTKGNFWMMIKNPLYWGKIVVPKYKDEDAQLVDGQHEAIISEGLFYRVQDVLAGRSRNYRPKIQTTENFPLRGFFLCPQCDRKLTGSKCKGRHKHYYYYHCEASCKYRINSDKANEIFIEHLSGYRPIPEVKKLYSAVLLEAYKEQTGNAASEKKKMLAQITEYEKKLSNARNLLVTEKIDVEDYNLMKSDYNSVITKLEKQLHDTNFEKGDIEDLMSRGLNNLISLGSAYEQGTLADARELIGLIYPENFTFLGNNFQTARVNEIMNCIYLVNSKLKAKKKRDKRRFFRFVPSSDPECTNSKPFYARFKEISLLFVLICKAIFKFCGLDVLLGIRHYFIRVVNLYLKLIFSKIVNIMHCIIVVMTLRALRP